MDDSTLILWALTLFAQNGLFTLVSRARNSGSYGFHAGAALLANTAFYVSQFGAIAVVTRYANTRAEIIAYGLIYVAMTTAGSVVMHVVSHRYIERGSRKVGA